MSPFVKPKSPKFAGIRLPLSLAAVWLLALAAAWLLYQREGAGSGGILNFVGRFHLVLVHLPLGVILLAAVMELLSHFTAFGHFRRSLPFVHWIAFLGALAASLAGYLLMSAESYAGGAMDLHMWLGLGTVAAVLLTLVFSLRKHHLLATAGALAALAVSSVGGHLGRAMAHTPAYLSEHAPEALKPLLSAGLGGERAGREAPGTAGGEAEEAEEVPLAERVVYTGFVVPILEATCNECHNENKIRGKLRMDTHGLLLAGAEGSDFPTVAPGDAEGSELIVRVTLPEDDDDFMPPDGEGLKPEEIRLLSLWIAAGAGTETTVAELGDDPGILAVAAAVEALHSGKDAPEPAIAAYESVWDALPPEEQEERLAEAMAAAERYGFSIMPVSAEDERLRVNVINAAKEFGDEQLALLEPVAERVVWLDLGRSQVTDEGMAAVAKMRALERLHLENTAVGDAGVARLAGLERLEYLNLYGTQVGNGIFETFRSLPNLQKVYVWQTGVEAGAARAYERSVNLEINTGVDLAASAVEAEDEAAEGEEPEAEAKPEPAAAPAPQAPAEPKPDGKAKAKAKAAPAAQAEPQAPPQPDAKPDGKAKGKAPAEPEPVEEPDPEPDGKAKAKAPAEPKPEEKQEPEAEPKPEPEA